MSPPGHLYVHVPFCARRCSYCDFAIAVRRNVPTDDYLAALDRELGLRRGLAESWPLETLYFGGGTPSRLGGEGVARMLDLVRRYAEHPSGAEVTLEANPDDVTPESAARWRAAGVNRLSLGAQSFDEGALEWMHRTHDANQAERAFDIARGAGIENISLDLIFALPAVLRRRWDADLERALSLRPAHISLYGLTVEKGTPLGRWTERGTVSEAPEEQYERDFLLAHDVLTSAGYEHYEVSNYALPGQRSRHNSSYWSGAAYEGVGPSAHAFSGGVRRWNVAPYEEWRRRLGVGGDATAGSEALTTDQILSERIYLGLRTDRGVQVESGMMPVVAPWIEAGWAEAEDGSVRLTPRGWLRLDTLATALTMAASRY